MKDYPLIKYVVTFIIGIILQSIINIEIQTLLYFFIFGFIISPTLYLIFKKVPRSLLISLSIYFLIFITGASYLAINNLVKSEYPFEKSRIKNAVVGIIIITNKKMVNILYNFLILLPFAILTQKKRKKL